jgi:hypothetical protein
MSITPADEIEFAQDAITDAMRDIFVLSDHRLSELEMHLNQSFSHFCNELGIEQGTLKIQFVGSLD